MRKRGLEFESLRLCNNLIKTMIMDKYFWYILGTVMFLLFVFIIKLEYDYRVWKHNFDELTRKEVGAQWAKKRKRDEMNLVDPKVVIRKQYCPGRHYATRNYINKRWQDRDNYVYQECRVWFINERTLDTIRIDFKSKSLFDSLKLGDGIDTLKFNQIDRILY